MDNTHADGWRPVGGNVIGLESGSKMTNQYEDILALKKITEGSEG